MYTFIFQAALLKKKETLGLYSKAFRNNNHSIQIILNKEFDSEQFKPQREQ